MRFERIAGGISFCVDKQTVLMAFDRIARAAANALKQGETLSLRKEAAVPEGEIFARFAAMRDRSWGKNPHKTIGEGILEMIEEHNRMMEKLSAKARRSLGLSIIKNPYYLESGGYRTLKGLLDFLSRKGRLAHEDSLYPNLLQGHDLPYRLDRKEGGSGRTPTDPRIVQIRH